MLYFGFDPKASMTGKSKISARDTYVLDPDEINQLDELSLTSVMRQVTDPAERPGQERKRAPTASVDTTIDELLKGPEAKNDLPEAPEALDDLIAPEILFPESIKADDEGS